jgi:hypothetical protein
MPIIRPIVRTLQCPPAYWILQPVVGDERVGVLEEFARTEKVTGSSDRGFGLTVGGLLAAIGVGRLSLGHSYALEILGVGVALIAVALIRPPVLAPLNRAWTRLGLVVSKVVNPVVMTLLFCLTIVPFGVLLRLAGKDLLRLKRAPQSSSYWIVRERPEPEAVSMRNQF